MPLAEVQELMSEIERLRAALVASDAGMQTLRRQHQTACAERERLKEALDNVCDAAVERLPGHEYLCKACDYQWHADQLATDRVHGERCPVDAAQRLLKELHR